MLLLVSGVACSTQDDGEASRLSAGSSLAPADTLAGWSTVTGATVAPWEADSLTVARYLNGLQYAAADTQLVEASRAGADSVRVVIEAVEANRRIGAAEYAADGRVVFRVRLLDPTQRVESVGLGSGRTEGFLFVTREATDTTSRAFRSVMLARGADGRLEVVRRGSVVMGLPAHDTGPDARVFWNGRHADAAVQRTRDSTVQATGALTVANPLFDPCFACSIAWCGWVDDT